jgi:hypothetical protein
MDSESRLTSPYRTTVTPWLKKVGVITDFRQIARSYTLWDGARKAFDENGELLTTRLLELRKVLLA